MPLRVAGRKSALKPAAGLLLASFLAGCATDKEPRAEICPSDRTLVCVERMGKLVSCSCKSKESLREILEPYPE